MALTLLFAFVAPGTLPFTISSPFTSSLYEGRAHDLTLLKRPWLKRGGSSAGGHVRGARPSTSDIPPKTAATSVLELAMG